MQRSFFASCGTALAPWLVSGLALAPGGSLARTLFVSALTGSNSNAGTSAGKPLKTIQYAAGLTKPGDVVMVMAGTYTNDNDPGGAVLFVQRSGTAAAPITYENYLSQRPVLQVTDSWAVIRVSANYIVLSGFEIVGNAASITPAYGLSQARNLLNPLTNGDGIDVNQSAKIATPHHVTIENMIIHDVPGGGIGADNADYITIENNLIYNTSNWSPYGDSAISVFEPADIDASTGYKIVVEHNTTYNNAELVPCSCRNFASISDGNGIIIDDTKGTLGNNVRYHGRTLIAGNISFGNGGSGIHAYSSQHIDILNNTAYDNNLTPTIDEGQIFSDTGSDVNIVDNILVAPGGKPITSSNGNATTVSEDYNVLWNMAGPLIPPAIPGRHDILSDPMFTNAAAGVFTLRPGSPAIGSAQSLSARAAVMPASIPLVQNSDRGAE
jgi:parallel beta-helix repeat protein